MHDVKPEMQSLDWVKNINIYEVNIRQYTREGTFDAFAQHLPRLKAMGVDVLWLMPVFPIGMKNGKGTLGSPYSIRDYKDINSEYGTKEDFKALVEQAHELGMKVILDWVANHTSFDHVWIEQGHKDWYSQDENGQIIHPKGTDWVDTADLNFDNEDMRAAMLDTMKYWVEDFDIDGYRCDMAMLVPFDFWAPTLTALREIKPLFFLAEAEGESLTYAGFNTTYAWHMHHVMNAVAQGHASANDLEQAYWKSLENYQDHAFQMQFTTNHDENSWNGTVFERMGGAVDAMAVFAFTCGDMPLIYSGQEAGMNKRLEFFEKDEIDWSDISKEAFFTTLLKLRHENEALWNGNFGGKMQRLSTSNNDKIFAFKREKNNQQVIVMINMSREKHSFTVENIHFSGTYKDVFEEKEVLVLELSGEIHLDAWGYRVLVKK